MTTCEPAVVDLCRDCRLHVSWPVTGITEVDRADAYLDGSTTPVSLTPAPDLRTVIGYFAGPAHPDPGVATIVTRTSWVQVVITTATETLTFPGGFIRLTR